MTTQNITSNDDLLSYLISRANSGDKNWFGFLQQRVVGIDLAYRIAANHADKMTPEEIVNFVDNLNSSVYKKLIKGETI